MAAVEVSVGRWFISVPAEGIALHGLVGMNPACHCVDEMLMPNSSSDAFADLVLI